jgi:hypothetical protein
MLSGPDLVRAPALVALIVSLSACGGAAPPPPVTPTDTAAEEPPQGEESATLDVLCTPPAEVKVDGKSIGTSPINAHKVPPGPHDVTCVDPRMGPSTMSVTLEPGEGRSVTLGGPSSITEPPTDKPADKNKK